MKNTVLKTISRAKGKLQVEGLVKGVAILIAFLLLGSFLFTFVLARNNFSDSALLLTRTGGVLGALFLFGYYIFRPLWNSPSKRQVARFLEERYPQLKERVSTAVGNRDHLNRRPSRATKFDSAGRQKTAGKNSPASPVPSTKEPCIPGGIILFSGHIYFSLSEGARGLSLQSEQIAAMVRPVPNAHLFH